MTESPDTTEVTTDPNEDRYRGLRGVIQDALRADDFPDDPVERFEVNLLANGESTWRAWPARAEEPIGGYLPIPD